MSSETQDFSLQEAAHADRQVVFHWLGHAPNPGTPLGADELPGVTTMGYWETRQPRQGPYNKPQRIPDLQISLCEHGEGMELESIDGKQHTLFNNALVVTLPWEAYTARHTRGTGHWLNLDVGAIRPNQSWTWPDWCVLTPQDRKELAWRWRQRENPVMAATPEIREAFACIAKDIKVHEAGRSSEVSSLAIHINALLLALLRMFRAGSATQPATMDSRNEKTVRLFWEEWDQNPRLDGKTSVPDMAAACGLCVTTFIAFTKQVSGETPAHRILTCRLEKAGRLLRERPDLSVLDVALECGFSSSQYFATCFAKRHRISPMAWRKRK